MFCSLMPSDIFIHLFTSSEQRLCAQVESRAYYVFLHSSMVYVCGSVSAEPYYLEILGRNKMLIARATEWRELGILGTRVHVVISIEIRMFSPINSHIASSGI